MKAIWVTWERQQRNRSMASELQVPLLEIDLRCGPMERYLKSAVVTMSALHKQRPSVVFFQNPSIALGLLLVVLRKLWLGYHFDLIGDFHNVAVQGRFRWASRYIARSCHTVIVSNDRLAKTVTSWGGRPFSLPDPLPKLNVVEHRPMPDKPFVILFICSWADDEPVENVLAAAAALQQVDGLIVKVTGRPKEERVVVESPNVVLTGFLPDHRFFAELGAAHVVMDLTTREDCMVCGAYEGLSLSKPLILSDNPPTMAWFGDAAVYTSNEIPSIIESIQMVIAEYSGLRKRAAARKRLVQKEFEGLKRVLVKRLG